MQDLCDESVFSKGIDDTQQNIPASNASNNLTDPSKGLNVDNIVVQE